MWWRDRTAQNMVQTQIVHKVKKAVGEYYEETRLCCCGVNVKDCPVVSRIVAKLWRREPDRTAPPPSKKANSRLYSPYAYNTTHNFY